MDLFENVKTMDELYKIKINIPDEIPNEMPKYTSDFLSGLKNFGSSIEDFSYDMLGHSKEFVLKEAFNAAGMYGFVSWKWIDPLVKWIGNRKCLEVMAGR